MDRMGHMAIGIPLAKHDFVKSMIVALCARIPDAGADEIWCRWPVPGRGEEGVDMDSLTKPCEIMASLRQQ